MKKLYLLLALLLPATAALNAQNNTQDVVYLKNGSILRGKLIPAAPGNINPKIELAGGSVFVLEAALVDSITKENLLKAKLANIKKDYYRRNTGFRNITELGIIYGTNLKPDDNAYYNNNNDDFGLSLHTVNGYQWWPYLFTGAGLGIDRFISYQQTFSPFYGRVACEFLKKRVTPYVYCDAGYAVMWQRRDDEWVNYNNKGGLYLSAGGGLRIYTTSRASVLLSVAYKRNSSESRWWYKQTENYVYATKRTYQRVVLNIGVTF